MTNNNNQNNNQNQNTNPFGANNNNQNNNNSGSRFGSSRFGNNNNNQNNNNSSSRFGSSRFSNNNNNNQNNNQNNNNSRFGGSSSSSRFGNNNSRFGANRFGQQSIYWTVAPMTDAVVRISLDGLGDPFHRLLGMPLNVEFGQPEKVVEALQSDEELMEKMSKLLDETWATYEFEGAALLFPWDEDVKKAYSQPVFPNDSLLPNNNNNQNNNNNNNNNQNNNQNNNNDDFDDFLESSDAGSDVTCLRAIDLAFVLNMLARSRANVVVGNTPLALEPGFLTQTVVCDDPRIVALVRATGCIDEKW